MTRGARWTWSSWRIAGGFCGGVAVTSLASAHFIHVAHSDSLTPSSPASTVSSLPNAPQHSAMAASQEFQAIDVARDRSAIAPPQALKLVQVHVLFRHGDRSPMPIGTPSPAENSLWQSRLQPHPSASLLPPRSHSRGLEYPFGQLTRKGANQAMQLGERLRSRYGSHLILPPSTSLSPSPSPSPSPSSSHFLPSSNISIRSTDFPRTYMSAFYVLTGLTGAEEMAARIPISIRSPHEENLYENDECARGALLWHRAWRQLAGPIVKEDGSLVDVGWRLEMQELKQTLQHHFKLEEGKRFPWVSAIDFVDCMRYHGDTLPSGVSEIAIDKVRKHLSHDYTQVFSNQKISTLAMGRLADELETSMASCVLQGRKENGERKALKKRETKPFLFLYSGHDSTLMPLSASWGRPFPTWPSYSSSITIELWASHDNQQFFVRVLYNEDEVALPRSSPHPGKTWIDPGPWREKGSVLCTWEEFSSLISHFQISKSEFEKECAIASHL